LHGLHAARGLAGVEHGTTISTTDYVVDIGGVTLAPSSTYLALVVVTLEDQQAHHTPRRRLQ
jgi:hypothetical protein